MDIMARLGRIFRLSNLGTLIFILVKYRANFSIVLSLWRTFEPQLLWLYVT